MELWIILFLLVVAISFFLAYQSMRDFQEGIQHTPVVYGIYLIKKPAGVTVSSLNLLHSAMFKKKALVAFETLFKGGKKAHVVFGPKEILEHALHEAQLVELEDYTSQVDISSLHAWEMELRGSGDVFANMPDLIPHEHFWWQVVLSAREYKSSGNILLDILEKITDPFLVISAKLFGFPIKEDAQRISSNKKTFAYQIRCIFSTDDLVRRRVMGQILEKLNEDVVIKTPKPLTSAQIFDSYLLRTVPSVDQKSAVISLENVTQITGLIG